MWSAPLPHSHIHSLIVVVRCPHPIPTNNYYPPSLRSLSFYLPLSVREPVFLFTTTTVVAATPVCAATTGAESLLLSDRPIYPLLCACRRRHPLTHSLPLISPTCWTTELILVVSINTSSLPTHLFRPIRHSSASIHLSLVLFCQLVPSTIRAAPHITIHRIANTRTYT